MAIIARNSAKVAIVWALCLGASSLTWAQSVGLPAPRLLTITPMGGKVGTDVEVAVSGEYLDEAGDLLFSDRRITAKRKLDASGAAVSNRYVVAIAADCPSGLYEARVMTRLGVSSSRIFAVGSLTEVTPTKPNRTLATAQEMPLNSV